MMHNRKQKGIEQESKRNLKEILLKGIFFGSLWVLLWLHLAPLWLPFAAPLAGMMLFGYPLAPFWLPCGLDPLWLPLGSGPCC